MSFQQFQYTAKPQLLARLVWPRGGFRPAWSKTLLASSLLAFLETYTEADKAASGTLGIVVANSRTLVRPAAVPGTTPYDPFRARCRSGGINHRVASRIGSMVPVRGPLSDISVHIKKAPRVGRIIAHITGLAQSTYTIIGP